MKLIRILGIVRKRVLHCRSLVLSAFVAGLFLTHAAACAVSWHSLHALLAGGALLWLALELQSFAKAARL